MTNALTAFAIAVCGVSLICFALMTRAARGGNRRKSSTVGGGPDGGTYISVDSGSHFWSWFGDSGSDGRNSSGGGDGWGGGDSGGVGDGGGGDGGGGGD